MVRNKNVLFIVAPLLTLTILNAINPIQEPILKGNDEDPAAFLRVFMKTLNGNTTSRYTYPRNFKRDLSV